MSNNRLFGAATLALALALTVSHASADEVTFKLPVSAHFGNATLQPGYYRMTLPTPITPINAIYLYGGGKVQATLPAIIDTQELSDRSYLELVNVGGTYFAKKFISGVTGTTYTFSIPKAARRQTVANTPVTMVAVTGGAAN
ncbi:MAG: hypothetical protein JO145_03615 [Acidobacteriaceae bacterium]|nr:hypothetical protein [Acidobacteriaceae bacterium]MBV9765396.1 hypothetical protein [Acidobacteriaceae bacterium]